MKDCKKHYKEMYETRLGEVECPWCRIKKLQDRLFFIKTRSPYMKNYSETIQKVANDALNDI